MAAGRSSRAAKPTLLWLNVAATPQDPELRVASARFFHLENCTRLEDAASDISRVAADALCFEFDRPDAPQLVAMQAVLRDFPRLPALMLTVQHSEALAVWAFRSGVWNYLVKPVPLTEFSANLAGLAQVSMRRLAPVPARPPDARVPPELSQSRTDPQVTRLQPALQYVRRRLGEHVCEKEAAALCGMPRFGFSRSFHAAFGLTFRAYLMRSRIAEARRLLAEGNRTVTEVAYATGFTDGSHFARMFRRYTGMLPSEYLTAGADA